MVDKYPILSDAKQNVRGLEIARLRNKVDVPLVATSEQRRIVLHYWRPAENVMGQPVTDPGWHAIARDHFSLGNVPSDFLALPTHRNSQTVGLAATEDQVFLLYKRTLRIEHDDETHTTYRGLLMDRFSWNETTNELTRVNDEPIQIALGPDGSDYRAGFHLWADYCAEIDNLVIVLQGYQGAGQPAESDVRVLFRMADLSDPGLDFTDFASWRSLDVINRSFEFGVKREGTRLHMVQRESVWPVNLPFGTSALGSALPEDSYAYLTYWALDLELGWPADVQPLNIPGGEHPQIHSINPLIVTFDRPIFGQVSASQLPWTNAAGEPMDYVDADVQGWTSHILVHVENEFVHGDNAVGTSATTLVTRDRMPRWLSLTEDSQLGVGIDRRDPENPMVGLGTAYPMMPVYLIEREDEPEGNFHLTFLHHDTRMGTVLASRMRVSPHPPDLDVQMAGQSVIDINHRQVDNPSTLSPSGWPENTHFLPTADTLPMEIDAERGIVVLRRNVRYDNTIGGHLRVERRDGTPAFIAYTDIGDASPRVLFGDLEPVTFSGPAEIERLLGPDQVIDLDTARNSWITLAPPTGTGWMRVGLPVYSAPYDQFSNRLSQEALDLLSSFAPYTLGENRSWSTGIEGILDLVLDLVPIVSTSSINEIFGLDGLDLSDGLQPADANMLDEAISTASRLGGSQQVFTTGTPAPFEIEVTMADAQPRRGQAVDLSASLDGAISLPVIDPATGEIGGIDYDWTVREHSPGEDPASPATWVVVTTFDTANFQHTTNAASSALNVTLRVDTGVHKKSINFRVPLGQTLWNQIWSVHGQFNSDDRYSIGRADLTLDKYSISFRGTAAGAQNAVMVAIRPDAERDTEMRFRGSNQQGLVDQRFRITFASPDIQVNFPVARDIVRVNWVFVEFFYERPYTPAILAQDRRDRDPVRRTSGPDDEIETVWDPFSDTNMPASLAMKPAGDAVVTPGEIRVNVNLTLRGGP